MKSKSFVQESHPVFDIIIHIIFIYNFLRIIYFSNKGKMNNEKNRVSVNDI